MKKIIITLILLLTISILFGCTKINSNESETIIVEENIYSGTCPHRLIDDPYPCECGIYVDKNQNNICDRSE